MLNNYVLRDSKTLRYITVINSLSMDCVISFIKPIYKPVAVRKCASSKSNSFAINKKATKILKPKGKYFEPFLANEPCIEQLSFSEFYCNKYKHVCNLNWLSKYDKQYIAKNYMPRRDIGDFASDKSKDFFDDATMEYVRHNLFQLSSIEGVVTGGPPAAITFHSKVTGKRKSEEGKVNYLLHWSPENIVPDTWVAAEELVLNLEKTIPVSQLPPEALQLPVMDAFGLCGILSAPGKRKRK